MFDDEQFGAWTKSVSAYPRDATVHGLFAEQARRTPEARAVKDGQRELTYRRLNEEANRVAWSLIRAGVAPGGRVAIAAERSVELVVAELAVLKAGASYLPLDVLAPPQRLAAMCEDAAVSAILADGIHHELMRGTGFPILPVGPSGNEAVSLVEDPPERATASAVAYVMFTSGSTGTPKGVEVVHRGIVRLVRNTNYVQLDERDVVGQIAHPAFDAITFEVWGALLNGGRLVIVPAEVVLSPQRFAAVIQEEAITTMFLTSSLFSVMAARVPAAFGSMRTLIVGGDAVDPGAARKVLTTAAPGRLVNGYGPTEATTFAVCHHIDHVPAGTATVPIGRPICNSEAYILDEALHPVGPGVAGDLYLGGDGLARGYLNRPELTAQRFLPHPFDPSPGARLYQTGDRARFRTDGVIEFLGRRDHQIKFHGYRIELPEIEVVLKRHPQVIDAVVKVWDKADNDQRLVGYVAGAAGGPLMDEQDLRRHLAASLPPYMIPSRFVVLPELPRTSVGKVDRAALPWPRAAENLSSGKVADSGLEARIGEVWQDVLSLDAVGADQNFFDAGGTSLTLALVEDKLRAFVSKPFSVTDLFRYPTIRSLARFLGEEANSKDPLAEAKQRAARQRAAFMSGGPRAKGRS